MEEKVKIYHAKNKKEADRLLLFLKANGVEGTRQQLGEGVYRDLYAGNRWYGEEILVDETEEQKAKVIVQAFLNAGTEKKKNPGEIWGRVLLIGAIVVLVLTGGVPWILSFFNL